MSLTLDMEFPGERYPLIITVEAHEVQVGDMVFAEGKWQRVRRIVQSQARWHYDCGRMFRRRVVRHAMLGGRVQIIRRADVPTDGPVWQR